MRCPKCGKEIDQDSKFCIFCGGEVRAVPRGGRKCPKCGALNPNEVQYCSTCGASLLQQPTVTKAAPLRPTPQKSSSRICPSCKAKNDFDANYCDSCGASLSGETPSIKCAVCGRMNSSGGVYCESCGAVLSSSDASAISEEYASESYGTNPLKKIWRPLYEKMWVGSPVASSEAGFVMFLALIFVTLILIIGVASGSWVGAFCATGVIFLVATLLLALAAYDIPAYAPRPSWGEEPVDEEPYLEDDSSEE